MEKGTKYLRKLARVGRVYPKINTVQEKNQIKSTLSYNNLSTPLNE